VIAYVRNPSKLSAEATSHAEAVVSGSGTDSAAIKQAILSHNCDALVNAAGLASMFTRSKGPDAFPEIFKAVVTAAVEAQKERGGAPLRCWFLSGWALLDSPKAPYYILN
jgi:Flp pilus assembly protein TadD